MFLAYRYRLLPTKAQHRALIAILESQRELYNAALQERIDAYRKAHVIRRYSDQTMGLTEWRKSEAEARALPVSLQRGTLRRVDDAFSGFFARIRRGERPGFPRFRGRGWFNSFSFREYSGIRLSRNRIRFKGLPGSLRVHFHRPLPSTNIRKCLFVRLAKGWYVSFAIEVASKPTRYVERAVGVDLGVRIFAALSDGGWIPSLRAARRAERRLRVANRSLARKKRGSRNRIKTRLKLSRFHASIARQRRNHLHQASARLVRDYDAIAIESLRPKGLGKGNVAKDVYDASWGTFISMLRYKAARAGTLIVEVDPKNTSQLCSGCGVLTLKRLGERRHQCLSCGLEVDRDLNAARNILRRAGVGPGMPNVAAPGPRACENIGANDFDFTETLPWLSFSPTVGFITSPAACYSASE